MNSAVAQEVPDIYYEDQEIDFNQIKVVEFPSVGNNNATGLCMNCSHFSSCTFPMKSKAIFCEEFE